MNRNRTLLVSLLALALAACGGGGGSILQPATPDGGTTSSVASIQVIASSPQLASDVTGLATVDITAVVRDTNNVVLSGETVLFSASANGSVSVINPTTDANGQATARLSNGSDVSNRAISVTATVGTVSGSATVTVTGTKIRLTPITANMSLGGVQAYNAVLEDSDGTGIPNQTLQIASAIGNSLSATNLMTDASGQVNFQLTATQAGTDTVTVFGLGQTGNASVSVSGDSFAIITPAPPAPGNPDPMINLNTPQTVTARFRVGGAGVAGRNVQFFITRGAFVGGVSTATTDASGDATVSIQSDNSGPVLITALLMPDANPLTPDNLQASLSALFVATTAAALDLQAEPFSVRINEQATLTAIVRDAQGNLVSNKVVAFQVVNDPTGGGLSVPQATTDSQGKATTIYTAGGSTSAVDGVQLSAYVVGTPAATDTVNLTVTGQALAISLGTGNDLFEIGTATFAKEWVVFVTDADGNAVSGKPVQVSIRSVTFKKGSLYVPPGGKQWVKFDEAVCPDEDLNLNGILDSADNDQNANGQLEAGNIALVTAVPTNAPAATPCNNLSGQGQAANVITGSDGRARVCVFYPQNYNLWLDARIQARASVAGTEFSKSQTFELEALANDINNVNASPPGVVSPFGPIPPSPPANVCTVPPPP